MSEAIKNTNDNVEAPTVPLAIELGAGIYAVSMLLSFGWIGISLLQDGRTIAFGVILTLVTVTLLCRASLVGFIYFVALGFLLIAEPRIIRSIDEFEVGELLYAVSIIVFLISSTRYLVLTSPVLPYETLPAKDIIRESIDFTRSSLTNAPESELTKKANQNARLGSRSNTTVRAEEFLTAAARIFIALLIAYFLLKWFGPNPDARIVFGLRVSALRAASLAWFLVGLVLVMGLLFTPIGWLRHSPRQAGVYLRTQLTRWCFGDLRRIVRHMTKSRRKATVKRLKRGKAERLPVMDEHGSPVRADVVGNRGVPLKNR
jgi:hypothetical protein